ncbi:MAG TPA: extracellular solute-binding protein [Actinomycetota bacterium]|jgi:multiple sugar transport system substrate-binding protein|nr:extracellular solute-binding protein [Actinomycetota bacterium]
MRTGARFPRHLLALLVVLLVAGACTPGGSDSSGSEGQVVLKLSANAVKGGKNAHEAEWLEDWAIPAFEKQMADQGKKVDVQFVGSGADDEDFKTKLALDLKVGGGPDVISVDGPWVGEFAQAGYLKPLAEVAGSEVDSWDGWQQMPKPVIGIMEFDGKRYGVPQGTDGRVLFYNKALFTKAGLGASWQPKSWDEILRTARQLKAKLPGVTPLQINAGTSMGEATTAQGFLPLLAAAGKGIYDEQAGTWQAGAAVRDVLGFYQSVYREGLGDPRLQQRADGRDRSFAQFADGKIAVLAEGDYFWRSVITPTQGLAPMKDRDQAVGYALIPAKQPGAGVNGQDFVSLSGGGGWVINPNSKHAKEAWALIAFLASRPAVEELVKREPRLTSRNDVNQSALEDPLLTFIAEKVLPITTTRPGVAIYPQVSQAIQEATEQVATGKADSEKAAKDYAAKLGKVVGADKVSSG